MFRSASRDPSSARELIRRGRRGVGAAGWAAQSRTQLRTRLWEAARAPARKSARGHADPHAGLDGAMGDSLELPWDDYPSAHPLEIRPPRDDQRPPVRADANAPARALGRRGMTTQPPTLSRSTVRGPASFPPSTLAQAPPSRAQGRRASGRLPIRTPAQDPPSVVRPASPRPR